MSQVICRTRVLLLLCLLIGVTWLNAKENQHYRWRDAQGKLHIADRPPKDLPYQVLSPLKKMAKNQSRVVWQPVSTIKVTKAAPATKGKSYWTSRKKRCQALKKRIASYATQLRKPGDRQPQREKRRQLLWQKHKNCQ